MEFKNAFSILITKFGLVYRIILYVLIVILIITAIGLCFLLPTLNNIKTDEYLIDCYNGAVEAVEGFTENEESFKNSFELLRDNVYNAYDYIRENTSTTANLILMILVLFILYRFAITLCYVSISDINKEFMTSNLRYSFLANFIKNFRLALNFSLGYAAIFIPIDFALSMIVVLIVMGLFPVIGIFAFSVAMVAGIYIFALRMTLMSGVLPFMLMEKETNFFKALKKSMPMIKYNFRGFLRNIILALIVYVTLTTSCAISTAGVIPILSVAMFTIFTRILELCYYFRYKRTKYYIDFNTVVDATPFGEREDLVVDTVLEQSKTPVEDEGEVE